MIGNIQNLDTGLLLLWCIFMHSFMTTNTCNMDMPLHRMSTIGFVKRENKANFR